LKSNILSFMAVRCPKCKREYDVTLFEFGKGIVCECGERLSLKHEEIFERLEVLCRQYDVHLEEKNLSRLKRAHDKIAFLIMNTDCRKEDIEIEKAKFKELIRRLFPEKVHMYDLIYEPRFSAVMGAIPSEHGRRQR